MSIRRRILRLPKRLLRGTKSEEEFDILEQLQQESELHTTQYTIDDWVPYHPILWDWQSWKEALMFDSLRTIGSRILKYSQMELSNPHIRA